MSELRRAHADRVGAGRRTQQVFRKHTRLLIRGIAQKTKTENAYRTERSDRSSPVDRYRNKLYPATGEKWQREYIETPYQQLTLAQNNDPVYLVRSGDNSYGVSAQGASWDKCLLWDSGEDSYYDAESQCWLWYNTDVEPALWQYWYEGISSNYGDYGWMEHNSEGWWIEESEGNWIKLPEEYDTGALWYIE